MSLKIGTFKVFPQAFYQLYVFHSQRSVPIFPCILVLLLNKSEATSRRLMVVMSGWSPTNIVVDFKHCAINAIQANFTDANAKGCFFHLSSNS